MAQSPEKNLYIGLISGTSLDGIDAGLYRINDDGASFLSATHTPYAADFKAELSDLTQPGDNEIDRLGEMDVRLGRLFAEAAITLIKENSISAEDIVAIGCHGQTVRHRPISAYPFTLQIADPNTIAEHTNIVTVADFRRRDMSAGGQGAPFAPAFHRAMFFSQNERRCIVNIGGMANISVLNAEPKCTLGYDSGPGNVLMDAWIGKCLGKDYDEEGKWAASGILRADLLNALMKHPYITLPHPKSTGREDFHLDWLLTQLSNFSDLKEEDVQATLCEFSAETIADAIKNHDCQAVYLCGGGAHNTQLVGTISQKLPVHKITTTQALGIHPDWVETGIFAWLAKQRLEGKPAALSTVTGSSKNNVLGGVYHP